MITFNCDLSSFKGDDWDWTPPPESGESVITSTDATDKQLWLFNLANDPYETTDVSATEKFDNGTLVVEVLLGRLQGYYMSDKYTTPISTSVDETYDPANYGGVWEPWGLDDADVNV